MSKEPINMTEQPLTIVSDRPGRSAGEGGIYLVFFALFLTVLALFTASMIGLGMKSNSKIGAQNATNLASLACLHAFNNVDTDPPPPTPAPTNLFNEQANACRQAVFDVLSRNHIIGTQDVSEQISTANDICLDTRYHVCPSSSPYRITLGHYYQQNPNPPGINPMPDPENQSPCGSGSAEHYPCFSANPRSPSSLPVQTADAVKIETTLEGVTDQAWVRLLSSSGAGSEPKQTASAAIIPRCVSFLIDISNSTAFQTHKPMDLLGLQTTNGDGSLRNRAVCNTVCTAAQGCAANSRLFFEDAYGGDPAPVSNPGPPADCHSPGSVGDPRPAIYSLTPAGYISSIPSFTRATVEAPCNVSEGYVPPAPMSLERIAFCNMPMHRPDPFDTSQTYPSWHPRNGQQGYRSINDPDFQFYHYRDDFTNPLSTQAYGMEPADASHTPAVPMDVNTDRIQISDANHVYYGGPEPFTSFFMAVNASLRAMQNVSSNSDKALLMPFSLFPRNPEPYLSSAAMTKTRKDIGFLVQLSNLDNGGRIGFNYATGQYNQLKPAYVPNYMSKGWMIMRRPGYEDVDSTTNMVGAIDEALNRMQRKCPANAKKVIVLATDGVASCVFNQEDGVYNCANDYDTYEAAQASLLGPTLTRLRNEGVAVSVLFSGASVVPHILNRPFPNGQPGFMDESDARAFGYCGGNNSSICTCTDSDCRIVDQSSSCVPQPGVSDRWCPVAGPVSNMTAFSRIPQPGYYFGEPSGALSDLAFGTGGEFCPLLPKCSDNSDSGAPRVDGDPAKPNAPCNGDCYEDHDGDPATPRRLKLSARVSGAKQTCSVYDLTMSQQAADCTVKAVTGNSVVLIGDN